MLMHKDYCQLKFSRIMFVFINECFVVLSAAKCLRGHFTVYGILFKMNFVNCNNTSLVISWNNLHLLTWYLVTRCSWEIKLIKRMVKRKFVRTNRSIYIYRASISQKFHTVNIKLSHTTYHI